MPRYLLYSKYIVGKVMQACVGVVRRALWQNGEIKNGYYDLDTVDMIMIPMMVIDDACNPPLTHSLAFLFLFFFLFLVLSFPCAE